MTGFWLPAGLITGKHVSYNTFDVTENLKPGLNTVGAMVGNGFYNINRERYRKLVIAYGAPKMILKLEVHYSDGSKDIIVSDETWKTITFSHYIFKYLWR